LRFAYAPYVSAFRAKRKVIPHLSGRADNARMTRAHLRAPWIEPPSPTELWLGALLHAFAMLVLYAASFFRMRPSRLSRECHVDVTPAMLPEPESGITKETEKPAASSQTATQSKPTSAAAIAAIGCGGGCGCGCGGGGDNALIFPSVASPTRPRRDFGLIPHV
jgi:hypothetical protein